MSRAAQRLGTRLTSTFGPQPDWIRKKQAVDSDFDSAHGVDTGGITELKRLDVTGDAQDSVPHIASDPDEFHSAMSALGIDFKRFTFVDVGAGKGRALLLAAGYGFQRIIGVEFARELVEVAQRNIRAAGISATTDIVHADATKYELPDEPIVQFMYNPFGGKTMEAVARRTRDSFDRNPRPLHVVYVVPKELDTWVQAGFVAEQRDHYAILRPAPSA
ncbi:class I SAM-dependent methyltransferase [Ramlibacter sp. PS3R-8]|uniref:class I SAM-dependent methyltransferase n=1 Tax=Ramlibacter sp. PS3R-8 TaxID=3133437 RepID=UPI0030A98947